MNGLFSVDFPAVSSDLSAGSSEGTEVPHFKHGASKVCGKCWWLCAVSGNLRVSRTSIEELLVGMQKALAVYQVLEVSIVENNRAGRIKRREIIVTARAWTVRLQWRCIWCIDVRLIVYSIPKYSAPCLPDCVSSYRHKCFILKRRKTYKYLEYRLSQAIWSSTIQASSYQEKVLPRTSPWSHVVGGSLRSTTAAVDLRCKEQPPPGPTPTNSPLSLRRKIKV